MENKVLEALERMTEHLDLDDEYFYKQEKEDEKTIKQALTTKSKKEQAFEIIKEKGVNVGEFKKELDWDKFDYDFYMCYYRHFSIEELTKDEFISIIEVLNND